MYARVLQDSSKTRHDAVPHMRHSAHCGNVARCGWQGRTGHSKLRQGSPEARTEHSLHDCRALVAQVNTRYFLSDAETHVSLRIMYIEVRQRGLR